MFPLESFFEVGLCLDIRFVGVYGVGFLLKRELGGEFVFGGLSGLGGGRGALIHVSKLEVSLYIRGDGGRGVLRCSGRGRRFCEWLWREVGWGWRVCGWGVCVLIKWGWGRRDFFITI